MGERFVGRGDVLRGYDKQGRMITSVDAGGDTMMNSYDSGGRLVEQSVTPLCEATT